MAKQRVELHDLIVWARWIKQSEDEKFAIFGNLCISYIPTSGEFGLGVDGKREIRERLKESEEATDAELGDPQRDEGDLGRKKGNSDTVIGLPCRPSFSWIGVISPPVLFLRFPLSVLL